MTAKKYRLWYKCGNCGNETTREFPFGTKAECAMECTTCGCKELNPKPSKKPPVG